jgi:hypothetical protein
MSCYGCDDTGLIKQLSFRGQPCLCRICSECGETAPAPLETLDIKDNGSGYQPCNACKDKNDGPSAEEERSHRRFLALGRREE